MNEYKQRLSLECLRAWEQLGYGMFIHFGMSTFDGVELGDGLTPPSEFRPERLDVRSWVRQAREAGMRYAVLTTKHASGFCLWPSAHTDYSVSSAPVKTDVVGEFVKACQSEGIAAGLYYCSWDNHHKFGSRDHNELGWGKGYVTSRYEAFQADQIRELLENYPGLNEFWIDIPSMLSRGYKEHLYEMIAELSPETKILMNSGLNIGLHIRPECDWPTDLFAIERITPNGFGWNPDQQVEGARYYVPAETCETIGLEWFHTPGDSARSIHELTGMFYLTRCRNSNMLLNVGPDKNGLIPEWQGDALLRLRDRLLQDIKAERSVDPTPDMIADFIPKLSLRKTAGSAV